MNISRNRLVAFSFASADILLEVSSAYVVTFAAGATDLLLGHPPESLEGKSLFQVVAPFDRPVVRERLSALGDTGRLAPLTVAVTTARQENAWFTLSGNRLKQISDCFYLTLTKAQSKANDEARAKAIDESTGLLKKDAFCESLVEELGRLRTQEGEGSLSFFELTDLDAFAERTSQDLADQLVAEIGGLLRLRSSGQKCAGRVSRSRFSILHSADTSTREIEAAIGVLSQQIDPAKQGLTLEHGTIRVPVSGFDESTGTRVLVYAINQFAQGVETSASVTGLQGSFRNVLRDTLKKAFDFRRTLESRGFHLVFQPIVSLLDTRLHHCEALSRFPDSKHSPQHVIELAENIGWAMDFDLVVVGKVLSDLKSLEASQSTDTGLVSVNISAQSLMTDVFLMSLEKLFADSPGLRSHVILEVTETMTLSNLEAAERRIQWLRGKGHPVSLDDFGAGASSFAYIHALTVDCIKVDGKYVKTALNDRRDDAILRAMTTLCQSLLVSTIAEFVETQEQRDYLRAIGFDYGQGYYFGKPTRNLLSALSQYQ